MNYQKTICWGDSQTFGARSYGCYPLCPGKLLNEQTRYAWSAINLSASGHTAGDLWRRVPGDVPAQPDVYQACVLIGANDVGNSSPLDLFEEYNHRVRKLIGESSVARLVEFPALDADRYADPVHLNEEGNQVIAESFADAIMSA